MNFIKEFRKPILLTVIWVSFFVSTWVYLRLYSADGYLGSADEELSTGYYSEGLKDAKEAAFLNPFEANYQRVLAKAYILSSLGKDKETVDANKIKVIQYLEDAYTLNPNNLVTIRNEVPLYYFLALDLSASGGAGTKTDETYLPTTKNFLDMAKLRYKNDAGVLVLVAKYEKKLGLIDDFNDTVAQVKVLRPDLLDWNASLK